MALRKGVWLAAIHNLSLIGFSIYHLCWDSPRQEVWIAIIASAIGCFSSKLFLAAKENVVLPNDTI